MNLRVFYLTRRGLSDGYVTSRRRRSSVTIAALFRRVCNALCFGRLGVGASRRAALRIAAASAIEDFHKKAERFGYM